jgi:hypothetical protein
MGTLHTTLAAEFERGFDDDVDDVVAHTLEGACVRVCVCVCVCVCVVPLLLLLLLLLLAEFERGFDDDVDDVVAHTLEGAYPVLQLYSYAPCGA